MLPGVDDTLDRRGKQEEEDEQDASLELHTKLENTNTQVVLKSFYSDSSPSLRYTDGRSLDGLEQDSAQSVDPINGDIATQIVNQDILTDLEAVPGLEDTQIVANSHYGNPNDTQIVTRVDANDQPSSPKDPNSIKHSQLYNGMDADTQLVKKDDSQRCMGPSLNVIDSDPTQIVAKPTSNAQLPNSSPKLSNTQTPVVVEGVNTNVIKAGSSSEVLSGNNGNEASMFTLNRPNPMDSQEVPLSQSSPVKALVQIPNTVEREAVRSSLAQVQNTQEYLVDNTFQKDELEPRPIYSSSQKQEINTDEIDSDEEVLREESSARISQSDIINYNSVWAEYKFKMYPGILKETKGDQSVIAFEDGAVQVKKTDLHELDIRVSDRVRYEGQAHVVTGLTTIPGSDVYCIRGYNHIYIKRISKKKFDEILVPLSRCYMEIEDWMDHQQRFFIQTRANRNSFPPTRARQSGALPDVVLKHEQNMNQLRQRQPHNETNGVFAGCLFLLTNNDDRRSEIIKYIESNGGEICESLQDITYYEESEMGLRLKSQDLQQFKFAAVISNSYCRSAKFLEALAVGWPVISQEFVYFTLKNHQFFHLWPIFLLPAGHSQVLDTINSCNVYEFRKKFEANQTLDQQLAINAGILSKIHIIAVTNKKDMNKKSMSTCEFIFHAIGAQSLSYFSTVRQALNQISENWISDDRYYLYSNSDTQDIINEVNQSNYQGTTSGRRKKRKAMTHRIGVIDWEWVVQCVISGHAWEPEYIDI